jgi:hypothetical protein
VHLKKVNVERVFSPPTATVQVSLWFLPHFVHRMFIVGLGGVFFSSFLSITAISPGCPWRMFVFCFAVTSSIGLLYLHLGHLSAGEVLLATFRSAPHSGQKFTCLDLFWRFCVLFGFLGFLWVNFPAFSFLSHFLLDGSSKGCFFVALLFYIVEVVSLVTDWYNCFNEWRILYESKTHIGNNCWFRLFRERR